MERRPYLYFCTSKNESACERSVLNSCDIKISSCHFIALQDKDYKSAETLHVSLMVDHTAEVSQSYDVFL